MLKSEPSLNVREIKLKDIDLIADYWLKSDPDFMVSLGVDLNKLPKREDFIEALTQQINSPIESKKAYALIWEIDGKAVGHSNVNPLEFGKQATMHLHLWQSENRKQGLGTELVKMSLPFYFRNLKIQKLISEPYALNLAPNRTFEKIGFTLTDTYKTIPGTSNFEQEVNRWEISKDQFEKIS